MEEAVVQTSSSETQESPKTQPAKPAAKVNLDELDEFRKYKSAVDKRQNELAAQLEAARKTQEELETRLETLVTDPAAKAQMRTERLEHQLEYYKSQEALLRARSLFAERWNVPESAIANASNPSEMTELALDYLKKRVEGKTEEEKAAERQRELEKQNASGANDVSTATGTAPTSATALLAEKYAPEMARLKELARKGDANARVKAFKLQTEIEKASKVARPQV